ncbi:four-carbon acid sugar kinase family protein [Pelagibacterium sediminicola]|uniref:four-carbon acid sugar kinase family protein n=1 Tax=Pelagibacterium sediminicola TaxID=2248761 RepID=UPI000E31DD74|nr:four-carbon acid sugar kinase family protein [Pelagibacterium sediminicola]
MTRLAIIADDLTGALDTAAPFATRGLKTVVAVSPEWLADALATGPDVLGVSTNSREIEPQAARERVGRVVGQLPALPMVKKVDSRLKGNIEAELDAIAFEKALVVPAIPAFGRTVKDGMLAGFGIDTPISVAERLGHHARRALIPDTASEDDIAEALYAHPDTLAVGARGLAEAMAGHMAENAAPAPDVSAKRIIILVGSRDPITLAQVEHLRRGHPDVDHIPAPGGHAGRSIDKARDVTVIQAQEAKTPSDPQEVARRLAETIGNTPLEDALVLITGGATAQTVLEYLGIGVLEVLGEALPGLPIAQTKAFKLITKSGGFGTPGALLDIVGRAGGSKAGR